MGLETSGRVCHEMRPTKKHHEGRTGAGGQFLVSFEDCFSGISAPLHTIFREWDKRKDDREENKGRKKKRKVATADILSLLLISSFSKFTFTQK